MPEMPDARGNWDAALGRFYEAQCTYDIWVKQNPYPSCDRLPKDYDDATIYLDEWERGVDAVARPYEEAIQALRALPPPDPAGIIVKLDFIRRILDGNAIESDLRPFIEAIECDLRRFLGIPVTP